MSGRQVVMCRQVVAASFRDPSGCVFEIDGTLYRQVNLSYREDYDALFSCGLYKDLVDQGLLVPHEEAPMDVAPHGGAYKVIKPARVPFVSYPYEWCFSQLQDAARATLKVQRLALQHGMCLKDASAYNIQFCAGRPLLIDTLSFQRYREGEPWVAYRQFCKHFLAPLALASQVDVRLSQLSRVQIDGIPLGLASNLLPWTSRLNFGLLIHIHLHAAAEKRFADQLGQTQNRSVTLRGMLGLLDSLESCVSGLRWKPARNGWAGYYTSTNYDSAAMEHKVQLVRSFIEQAVPPPNMIWDLGANTGRFSRLASARGIHTLAFDSDPSCVEQVYREETKRGNERLLPLLVDLTNPSGAIGWANEERLALAQRGPADLVLALALVHHLAITNNVPLERIAAFLAQLGHHLIIEFVPKRDSMVQALLANRGDIFPEYEQHHFESAFAEHFQILSRARVGGSRRVIYLMRRL